MKPLFEVGFKHWWYWFLPSMHLQRKVLQAFLNANEAQIKNELDKQYFNLMLYGCTISPEEMYGKGDLNSGPESN